MFNILLIKLFFLILKICNVFKYQVIANAYRLPGFGVPLRLFIYHAFLLFLHSTPSAAQAQRDQTQESKTYLLIFEMKCIHFANYFHFNSA